MIFVYDFAYLYFVFRNPLDGNPSATLSNQVFEFLTSTRTIIDPGKHWFRKRRYGRPRHEQHRRGKPRQGK